LEWAKENNLPVHIGGDFNAHSQLWGSPGDSARGWKVEQLLFDSDLAVANEGQEPTFVTRTASTIIDLTVISPECDEYLSHWGVITRDGEIDHRPIESRYFAEPPGKKFRQSMKDVNWDKFRKDISERMRGWEIPRTLTRNQLDVEVDRWHHIVREVVNEHSVTKRVLPREPVVSLWYTQELKDERREVRRLCRRAESTRRECDWDAFRDARRMYTSNVRKAARECYQKFANDLPSLNDMARFCRMVRQVPRHDVGVMKLPSGEFTTTTEKSLEVVEVLKVVQVVRPPCSSSLCLCQGRKARLGRCCCLPA